VASYDNQAMETMDDFSVFEFAPDGDSARRVYTHGQGPAVVLLHELPGMIPQCVRLARDIAGEGFTVYLPLLFGEPNQDFSMATMLGYTAQLCISREFYCFAKHQSSPITTWLRALCRKARADCGGVGVGVIGMCLTGGFALALMADEAVIAPVASQPSLPFGITPAQKAALGVSPGAVAAAQTRAAQGVSLLALRFSEDKISPPDKFDTLRQVLGDTPETVESSEELCWKRGANLETIEINSAPGNPHNIPANAHAVLTVSYGLEPKNHPTQRVFRRVVEFLQEQMATQANGGDL
jgi:dienelactone hydrolase